MRAVSFVSKIDFEVSGNIMKDGLAIGDVDNDGFNELAIGTINGELLVFKGNTTKPNAIANELGMITSVLIGDITNSSKNSLIVISGEGFVYIFDVPCSEEESTRRLSPVYVQQFPACGKMALLADIDNDGNLELVLSLTDRVVRSYRWTRLAMHADGSGGDLLVALNKWELANQIGSISMHTSEDSSPCLLVAQPGATFVRLPCLSMMEKNSQTKELMGEMSLDYHGVTSFKLRNSNVTTEILGNLKLHPEDRAHYFAMATLDGTLLLVDGDTGHLKWSAQFDKQLFCLKKLDVTGDGVDEVVVASWSGFTLIVDREQTSVCFQFDESITAFTAGTYSLSPGAPNSPCLVYSTFSNRVTLYFNINLPYLHLQSLTEIINVKNHPQLQSLLDELGYDGKDEKDLQDLIRFCLYSKRT